MKKLNLNLKTNRKLRLGATATAMTVVVIAAVIVFNVIVGILYDTFPLSLDLTQDNTYTLSETSHKVAKNIKKDVEILVFAAKSEFESSTEIPLRQLFLFTQEYGKLSGGQVKTKYLDMIADPTLETKYNAYDVEYGDILFRCGDRHRKISVADLYSEEYDEYGYSSVSSEVEMKLASNINAISGDKVVTLTFLTGHDESLEVIAAMTKLYERNGYDIDTLDLATEKEPLDTTQAMFIVAPQSDFSDHELDRLGKWLHNGGNYGRQLVVLLDYNAKGELDDLYAFLENDYGIKVTNELIVETDAGKYLSDDLGALTLTQVQSSDLTKNAELLGKTVLMPNTLRLELKHGSDNQQEYVTNHPIITYGESAQTIAKKDGAYAKENASDKDAAGTALSYPLVGMAYAKETRQGSLAGEASGGITHVIVSGSYLYPLFSASQYGNYANDNLALYPIREICSLGDTVVIPSMDMTEATLSYSAAQARVIEVILFSVPVILVIVCLIVFLRRRHL